MPKRNVGRRALLATFVAVGLAACTESYPTPPDVVRRDSAGIEIVENYSPITSESRSWFVSDTPEYSIGVRSGDANYELDRVANALRLPDGTVAVANSGSGEIRLFDSAGRYRSTIGRPGPGPAEFLVLGGIALLAPDTIVALDAGISAKLFTLDGTYVRSIALANSGLRHEMVGPLRDGSFIVKLLPSLSSVLGIRVDSALYLRYDHEGRVDTLHAMSDGESFLFRDGDRPVYGYRPFRSRRSASASAAGLVSVAAMGGDLTTVDLDGKVVRITRVMKESKPVTARDIDMYKSRRLAGIDDPDRLRRLELIVSGETVPYPDSMSVWDQLVLDDEANAWVRAYRPYGTGARNWSVFDATGRWQRDVAVPDVDVMQVGRDYVLGLARDEDGVERLVHYHLSKEPIQ